MWQRLLGLYACVFIVFDCGEVKKLQVRQPQTGRIVDAVIARPKENDYLFMAGVIISRAGFQQA